MRKCKLNDSIDLDVHQMLTAIAARVGAPRAVVVNRMLREVLNRAHVGKFVLMHAKWMLWDTDQPIITLGTPGCRKLRENGEQPGQRFVEMEFHKRRRVKLRVRRAA